MIRFSKYIWIYFILSACIIVPGIFSLIRYGLQPSIDFAGGTLLELSLPSTIDQNKLEKTSEKIGLTFSSIQKTGSNTYLMRTKDDDNKKLSSFISTLKTEASVSSEVIRQETVGPVLGKELLSKAVVAAVFAIFGILFYVAYAFKNVKFGIAAIVALLHDLLVVLGSFSLFGHFLGVEVDTLFVTAFLTTMSFSVHDTIVVFDRIREYQKKSSKYQFDELSDRALTETMGRSLANSMTIIFMLVALVLLGGSSTYWFVVALLIGTVSGTYSSDFIATPVLVLWNRFENRNKLIRK
jgi:preprotein translocase subunit SecF